MDFVLDMCIWYINDYMVNQASFNRNDDMRYIILQMIRFKDGIEISFDFLVNQSYKSKIFDIIQVACSRTITDRAVMRYFQYCNAKPFDRLNSFTDNTMDQCRTWGLQGPEIATSQTLINEFEREQAKKILSNMNEIKSLKLQDDTDMPAEDEAANITSNI